MPLARREGPRDIALLRQEFARAVLANSLISALPGTPCANRGAC